MKNAAKLVAAGLAAVCLATPAVAEDFKPKEAGDFLVRLRAIALVPDESSSVSVIGGDVDASNEYVPEIDFTYFFTDNIAVSLIAATTKHDMKVEGSALGDVDLGDVYVLPPTVSLQYHFMEDQRFSPYVGAGLNYTIFYNEDAPGGTVTAIDYEDSIGYELQVGFDVAIQGNWSFNTDVKKIWLNTDVDVNNGAIAADVDLDPWVLGVGIGYRF